MDQWCNNKNPFKVSAERTLAGGVAPKQPSKASSSKPAGSQAPAQSLPLSPSAPWKQPQSFSGRDRHASLLKRMKPGSASIPKDNDNLMAVATSRFKGLSQVDVSVIKQAVMITGFFIDLNKNF